MRSKAAETDVHAADFGMKIGGLRPSDTSQGFFDSLTGCVLLGRSRFCFGKESKPPRREFRTPISAAWQALPSARLL